MRKCEDCNGHTPNVYRRFCNYCATRVVLGDDFPASAGDYQARMRMAAMDRAERPRVTRDSIELAKPHPWQCDEQAP